MIQVQSLYDREQALVGYFSDIMFVYVVDGSWSFSPC